MFVGASGSFYILCRKALHAAPARRVSCLTRLEKNDSVVRQRRFSLWQGSETIPCLTGNSEDSTGGEITSQILRTAQIGLNVRTKILAM